MFHIFADIIAFIQSRYVSKNRKFRSFADLVAFMQSRYVPEKGGYRCDDGSIDICHTELELLQMWNFFIKCVKPKTIVETGVYYGLSTCFLADAMQYNGIANSKIYCVDPWELEHYWNGLDLSLIHI